MTNSKMTVLVDDEYMRIRLDERQDGFPFIHADIYKWSKDLYELYLLVWCDIIQVLRKRGLKEVYATATKNDPMVLKFQEMFGFEVIGEAVSESGQEYYLTEYKLNGR